MPVVMMYVCALQILYMAVVLYSPAIALAQGKKSKCFEVKKLINRAIISIATESESEVAYDIIPLLNVSFLC